MIFLWRNWIHGEIKGGNKYLRLPEVTSDMAARFEHQLNMNLLKAFAAARGPFIRTDIAHLKSRQASGGRQFSNVVELLNEWSFISPWPVRRALTECQSPLRSHQPALTFRRREVSQREVTCPGRFRPFYALSQPRAAVSQPRAAVSLRYRRQRRRRSVACHPQSSRLPGRPIDFLGAQIVLRPSFTA